MKLSLAPMQGYSDLIYRTAMCKNVGRVDVFYAPYIKVENGQIRNKYLNDIVIDANAGMHLVPQVLTNNVEEMKLVADTVEQMGYSELNWNLGCPFPMVAKRRLGAGLLPYPETIDNILTEFEAQNNIRLSVKMRLGYTSPEEVWPVLDVLNQHNIKEIIIHPRIGKQMYGGEADKNIVPAIIEKSTHPVAYNGDIGTSVQARQILSDNPSISHLMIGRGLLRNPFLACEIKGEDLNICQKRTRLAAFVSAVADGQLARLQGAGHFLQKMATYWEFWSHQFGDQHKVLKMVKKCHTIDEYNRVVQTVTDSFPLLETA